MIARKTLFDTGFKRSPWAQSLGQDFLPGLVAEGLETYQAYQRTEQAEEERKAAEARAAAARAAAEAAAAQTAVAGPDDMILGIPKTYLIVGGAGLAFLALVAALTKG